MAKTGPVAGSKIAGPRTSLTSERMHELAPISNASTLFGKPPQGKG
jgi:hypothetical protein